MPVDINANLKIGSGTKSVRLTNAGILGSDGFRECGLGKFKVYHYKTGQTAPTPADGADLLSDETHTAGQKLDAYMTSAIHTVRIVFMVEKDESAGQLEQVVAYEDFNVTGIRINPAATVAATVSQTPCDWQKQTLKYSKLNGVDVAEDAGAPYDGYGAEISVALPTSLNYTSLWDFLIGREVKLTVTRGSEIVGVYGYDYNGGNIQEIKDENGVMFAETESGGQYLVAKNAGVYTFKFEITGPDYKWDTSAGAQSDKVLSYSVTVNAMKGSAALDIEKGVNDEGKPNEIATFNYGKKLKTNADNSDNGDIGFGIKYSPVDADLAWTFMDYAVASDGSKTTSWTQGVGEAEGDATETKFKYSFLYYGESTNGLYKETEPTTKMPTTPGTYYAIIKVEAFGNYAEAQSAPVQFKIKRQAIGFMWKYNYESADENPNYLDKPVYNASNHNPSDYIYIWNESNDEVLTASDWSFYEDNSFTTELADYSPKTAGKHTLYLKLSEEKSDLFEWSPETVSQTDDGIFIRGDIGAGKATLYFEIEKYTGNTLGVSISGWTYDDSAKTPVDTPSEEFYCEEIKHIYVSENTYNRAKAEADALEGDDKGFVAKYVIENRYAGDGFTIYEKAPENAGNYYVLAYITSEYGDDNDDFTSYNYCEAEKSFTIEKKGVKKPALVGGELVYDKTAQTVELSDYDRENMTVAIRAALSGNTTASADSVNGTLTATNADVYTITVSIEENYFRNHKWDDESIYGAMFTLTWTIKPHELKPIGETLAKSKEYGAEKQDFVLEDDANASDDFFDYSLIDASVSGNPYIGGVLDTSKNFVNTSLLSRGANGVYTLGVTYAGKYVVTITLNDTNYIWNTNENSYELTFDITPVSLTSANVDWDSEFSYIYDGLEHKPAPSFKELKGSDALMPSLSVTEDGDPVESVTEVGNYVMTIDGMSGAKLSGVLDGEDFDIAYGYVMPTTAENVTYHAFAITSSLLLTPSFTDEVVEYSGSAYEIIDYIRDYADNYIIGGAKQIKFVAYKNGTEAVGDETAQETLSLTDVVWQSLTSEKATIGSYTVVVSLTDPENYKWKATADDVEGTNSNPVSLTFKITPALIDFSLSTSASADNPYVVNYDGTAHDFTDIINDYSNISSRISVTDGVHTDVNRAAFGDSIDSYAVTVALEDKTKYNYVWADGSTDPTQGYNIADKTHYMRVDPAALEVVWTGTEQTYSGSNLSPTAAVSNHFEVEANKALTLSLEYLDGKDNAGTSGGAESVENAGYYTAYVAGLTGEGAKNYKIDFAVASSKSNFTILRDTVETPTFETVLADGNSAGEYDKTAHNVVVKDYDSARMSYEANAHDVRGKETGSIDLSSAVTEDDANKNLTITATRAGNYFVTFTLKNSDNYCFKGGNAAPDAENENSAVLDFELERKEVNAPTLARSNTREAGKVFVPVLYSTYGSVPSEKAYTEESTAASTIDFTLGDGWTVSANVAYGNTTSDAVDIYSITLTLSTLSDGESIYDYCFVKEDADSDTMSKLELTDSLSDNDTVLTVQYRITGSVFDLTFTIQNASGAGVATWTYGDDIAGFKFHTDSAIPSDYNLAKRTVAYSVYDENSKTYVEYAGETVSAGTDDITDKANFVAELPKSAGRYRAAVVYSTGDDSGNGVYEYEQRYIVEFTIAKREIEFTWQTHDGVTYESSNNMFTVVYDGASHMGYAAVTNPQYTDTLGLAVGLVGDTQDDPVPVKLDGDKNVTHYEIEIKSITGDAAANYVLPSSGLQSKLTIAKRAVTLRAGDTSHVFGDKATSDGANLNVNGAKLVTVTSGDFVASDSISPDSFAVTAQKEDGSNVLYNTAVGSYKTVVTPRDELTNYAITYVDRTFTVEQKVIKALWNNGTFTYDGTNQFAGYSDKFVYYKDVDGNNIEIDRTKVQITSGETTFQNAGSYTFTVTGVTDSNYRLALESEAEYGSLTHGYTMNKRTVAIAAKDITTAYGDDVSSYPLGWVYVGGTDKFVEDGGNEIEAGSSAPSVLSFGFASTAVKTSPVSGSYTTYLTYDGGNFTGKIELDNFTVNVSRGTHTIEKYELKESDIVWTAKSFVYDANDRAAETLGIATYTDRGDGATVHNLVLVAAENDSAVEFKNAGRYTLAVSALQEASTANLTLPGNYNLAWKSPSQYTIAKREVEIAVENAASVYGAQIGSDMRVWNYAESSAKFCDDDESAGNDGFKSRINIRVEGGKGTDDEQTVVGVHALELYLDGDKFTAINGKAEFDNYSVTFANGEITVRPRELNIDIKNLSHVYGDDAAFNATLVSRMVSVSSSQAAYGGLTSFDTLDEILVATTPANPEGSVRAAVASYAITLSLNTADKGNNYIVKFNPVSAAGEEGEDVVLNADVLNESTANTSALAAYYEIKDASFEDVSVVSYSESGKPYDGIAHAAISSVSLTYFGTTKNEARKTVSANAADNNLTLSYALTSSVGEPAASEFKQTVPEVLDAGTYYLYYRIEADNHETKIDYVTVVVTKKEVVLTVSASVYYGEDTPDLQYLTYDFDGLGAGESITFASHSGNKVSFNAVRSVNGTQEPIEGWKDGTLDVSTQYKAGDNVGVYRITVENIGFAAGNYTFALASTDKHNITVNKLPVIITVDDITDKYWFNGETTGHDLNRRNEGDFNLGFTLTTDANDIASSPITDIYSGDKTANEFGHAYENLFFIRSGAFVYDVNDNRTDMNGVGTYNIIYERRTLGGENGNYDLSFTLGSHEVTPADIKLSLAGYDKDYDEDTHGALVSTAEIGDALASPADKDRTGGATELDFKYALHKVEDGDGEIGEFAPADDDGYTLSALPEIIDAGTYYVYYLITGTNHNPARGSVTAVISKAKNGWKIEYKMTNYSWSYGSYSTSNNGETKPVASFKRVPGGKSETLPEISLYGGDGYAKLFGTYSMIGENWSWLTVVEEGAKLTNGRLLAAGSYKAVVKVIGNGNFDDLENEYVITVNKAELTLTPKTVSITYGDELDFSTLTYEIHGFKNDEDFSVAIRNEALSLEAGYGNDASFTRYAAGFANGSVSNDYYIRFVSGVMEILEGMDVLKNYKPVLGTATLTVSKKQLTVHINDAYNKYNFNVSSGNKEVPAAIDTDLTNAENKSAFGYYYGGENRPFAYGAAGAEVPITIKTDAFIYGDGGVLTDNTKDVGSTYRIYAEENQYANNYSITYVGSLEDKFGKFEIKQAELNINVDVWHTIDGNKTEASVSVAGREYTGTYSGYAWEFTAECVDSGFSSVTFRTEYRKNIGEQGSATAPLNAGTYYVRFVADNNNNYTFAGSDEDYVMTVSPLSVALNLKLYESSGGASALSTTVEYKQSPYAVKLSEVPANVPVPDRDGFVNFIDIAYSRDNTAAEPIDAGSYVATATVNSLANGNYTLSSGSMYSFTIRKKVIDAVNISGSKSEEYSGSEITFNLANCSEETDSHESNGKIMSYTIEYTDNSGTSSQFASGFFEGKIFSFKPTDAGTYTVKVKLAFPDNYEWNTASGGTRKRASSLSRDGVSGDTLTLTYTVTQKILYVKVSNENIEYGNAFDGSAGSRHNFLYKGFVYSDIASTDSSGNETPATGVIGENGKVDISRVTFTAIDNEAQRYTTSSAAGKTFTIIPNESEFISNNYNVVVNHSSFGSGILSVTGRKITVEIKDVSRTYTGSTHDVWLNGELAASLEGGGNTGKYIALTGGSLTQNEDNDTLAALGIRLTVGGGNAIDYAPNGYAISASYTNTNYDITFTGSWSTKKDGTFTIEKKTLDVFVGAVGDEGRAHSVVYGDPLSYNATYSGFVAQGNIGETGDLSDLRHLFLDGGSIKISTVRTSGTGAESYTVGASHVGDEYRVTIEEITLLNYKFNVTEGSIAVTPRTVGASLTANSVVFAADSAHTPAVQNAPVAFTNTVSGFASNIFMYSYEGTLKDGTHVSGLSGVSRAGDYTVTLVLNKNGNEEYDYLFAGDSASFTLADKYEIAKQVVNLYWTTQNFEFKEGSDDVNTISNYDDVILVRSGVMLGGVVDTTLGVVIGEGGKGLTLPVTKSGDYSISLTLKSDYENDYILQNRDSALSISVTLSFTTFVSEINLTVTISEWTYGETPAEYALSATEAGGKEFVLSETNSTIAVAYALLSADTIASLDAGELWNKPLTQNQVTLLAGERTYGISPVNAGAYMVRAIGSVEITYKEDDGTEAAKRVPVQAWYAFRIKKAGVDAPVFDEANADKTYGGGRLSATVGGYRTGIMSMSYAEPYELTADAVGNTSTLTLHTSSAGAHVLTVSLIDTTNYEWNAFTDSKHTKLEDGNVVITWTVSSGANTVTGLTLQTGISYGDTYDIANVNALFGGTITFKYAVRDTDSTDPGSVVPGELTWHEGFPVLVGKYWIGATSQGDANNYASDTAYAACEIVKAVLTVHAKDVTLTYGDAFTVEGNFELRGARGDDKPVLEGLPSVTVQNAGGSYFVGADVGTYDIRISSLSGVTVSGELADRYTVSFDGSETATLTVIVKPITVVINSQEATYDGTSNHVLDETMGESKGWYVMDDALVENESTHLLDTLGITLTKSASCVNVGSYLISYTLTSGGKNANYAITVTPSGRFTINPLTLNVTEATASGNLIYRVDAAPSGNLSLTIKYTYDGSERTLTVDSATGSASLISANDTFVLRYSGVSNSGVSYVGSPSLPLYAGSGYTVGLVPGTNSGNIVLVGASAAFAVEKRTLDGTTLQNASSLSDMLKVAYTGGEYSVSGSIASRVETLGSALYAPLPSGVNKLFTVTASDTAVHAGTYGFTLTLDTGIFHNYKWASVEVADRRFTFEIAQAANSVRWTNVNPSGLSWIYDGTLHEDGLGYTADFGADTRVWLVSSSENGNYEAFDAARHTGNGTHYVKAFIPGTADYAEATSDTYKVCEISARQINLVFDGSDEFIGGAYGDASMTARGYDFTDAMSGLNRFDELRSEITVNVVYVGRSFGGVDCGGTMPTLAGRYKVRISLSGEAANNFTLANATDGYVEGDYIIARQAVYGDRIVVRSFDFDGFAHTAEDSVKDNEFYGVKYRLSGSADANINADDYSFVLELIDPNNFYWFSHTGDRISSSTDAYRTFTYVIRRVDVVGAELDKLSFVRNGNHVELNAAGLDSEAMLWTYKDSISDVSATVVITVRTADGREYELENRTYGTNDDFIELQYLRDTYTDWGRLLPEDAGVHGIRVKIERTANINAPSSTQQYEFGVKKFALETPTLVDTGTGWTYSGERLSAYMGGSFDNDIMRVTFSDVSTEGGRFAVGAVNAGTHRITVDIRPSHTRNYMWTDESSSIVVEWKIEKAPNGLRKFDDISTVYGRSYASEATADFGVVKFLYYAEDGKPLAGAPRDAGDYFIEASVDGSDDYYGVAASRVKLHIDKKEIFIRPTNGTVVYGYDYTHDARGFVVEEGSFEYGNGYADISGAPEYYTAYTAGNAAGSVQTIAISGVGTLSAANYTFAISEAQSTLTVTKRPITIVIEDQSANYNGEIVLDMAKWSIHSSTPKFGSDIIAVTLSIVGGMPTSVGRYGITGEAVVGGNNSNENYEITFREGTYVVNALIITVSDIDVPSGLVFGDTAGEKATFTVEGVEGRLESGDFVGRVEILVVYYDDTTGITYSSMPASAGTYRAMIELASASGGNDNQNYRLGGTLSKAFTIARKAIDETEIETAAKSAGLLDAVYSGELRTPGADTFARIEGLAPIEGMYTASCAGGINVGDYSLLLTLTSDFARNYKWLHGEGSVASLTYTIIKNVNNTVTASFASPASAEFEYDGDAIERRLEESLTIGASFGSDNAVFEYASVTDGTLGEYSRTVPSGVGDYRVRVVISDTANYIGATSAALRFEITPRKLKATLTAGGGTYMSTISPASAVFEFADESFVDARLLRTAEHAVYYYGTSYDGTFSHTLADEHDVAPIKAGAYKAAVVLLNPNFVFVEEDGTETSALHIDFIVARIRVELPRQDGGKYDVDDTEYTLTPYGFDETVMTISGNSAKKNGDYTAVISLRDKANYEWASGTSDDFEMAWTLRKDAPVDFIATVTVLGTMTAAAGALLAVMLVRRKKLGY